MNKKFAARLEEYLNSECSDYSLTFTWRWNEDADCCDVTVMRDDYTEYTKEVRFKYNEEKDDLLIELCEDSWQTKREFDQTVKYFWMVICPTLFPDN